MYTQSHAVAYIGHRNTIKKKAYRPTRRLDKICLTLRTVAYLEIVQGGGHINSVI